MIDAPVGMPGSMKIDAAPGLDASWGDEAAYFSQPPASIPGDATWCSVFLFYVTLLPNLVMGIVCAFIPAMYRWLSSVAICSAQSGRPLYLAFPSYWYQLATVFRLLVSAGGSRFTLFSLQRETMGGGDWWWHGEGAWNCPYMQVRATMASDQKRAPAFGAVQTCVPELFPEKLLLFLDGDEWKTVRGALVKRLTTPENWAGRAANLPAVLAKLAPSPCNLDTLTKTMTDKIVAAGVWYLLFGIELTDEQAATVALWGGSGYAGYFVFPRLIHRIAFNALLKRVKQLRIDTLAVFSAHNLRPVAREINESLGAYKRPSALALADEMMYLVNFAGVGGTQHGTWGTLQMMRRTTTDVKPSSVTFPPGSMVELYKANPLGFIKEAQRLDAPVTSATCVFAESQTVDFNVACCCSGPTPHEFPKGTLQQYVLSIANRDPSKFEHPKTFNPSRENIDDILVWNGAISGGADKYPRFCPGFEISTTIMQAVVSLLDEMK